MEGLSWDEERWQVRVRLSVSQGREKVDDNNEKQVRES